MSLPASRRTNHTWSWKPNGSALNAADLTTETAAAGPDFLPTGTKLLAEGALASLSSMGLRPSAFKGSAASLAVALAATVAAAVDNRDCLVSVRAFGFVTLVDDSAARGGTEVDSVFSVRPVVVSMALAAEGGGATGGLGAAVGFSGMEVASPSPAAACQSSVKGRSLHVSTLSVVSG